MKLKLKLSVIAIMFYPWALTMSYAQNNVLNTSKNDSIAGIILFERNHEMKQMDFDRKFTSIDSQLQEILKGINNIVHDQRHVKDEILMTRSGRDSLRISFSNLDVELQHISMADSALSSQIDKLKQKISVNEKSQASHRNILLVVGVIIVLIICILVYGIRIIIKRIYFNTAPNIDTDSLRRDLQQRLQTVQDSINENISSSTAVSHDVIAKELKHLRDSLSSDILVLKEITQNTSNDSKASIDDTTINIGLASISETIESLRIEIGTLISSKHTGESSVSPEKLHDWSLVYKDSVKEFERINDHIYILKKPRKLIAIFVKMLTMQLVFDEDELRTAILEETSLSDNHKQEFIALISDVRNFLNQRVSLINRYLSAVSISGSFTYADCVRAPFDQSYDSDFDEEALGDDISASSMVLHVQKIGYFFPNAIPFRVLAKVIVD